MLSFKQDVFSFLIVSLSIILYSYYMITEIMTEGEAGTVTKQAICLLLMELISVAALLTHKRLNSTILLSVFFAWVIWLFIDFFVLGLKGEGLSNFFLVIPCPFAFFYYFYLSFDEKIKEKYVIISFCALLVVTGTLCVVNMMTFKAFYMGNDPFVSNLVFWPLCTMPFMFLIKKHYLRWSVLLLLAILVLLTAKRSATICFIITIALYVLFLFKRSDRGKNRSRLIIAVTLAGVVSFYVFDRFFSTEIVAITGRLSSMQEDEGSGRTGIYQDVFKSIDGFSFDQYIVGRGYHSITKTGHTNAHNDALQVFYEYGLIGLMFYILISVIAFKRLLYVRKHLPDCYPGYMASMCIYVMLGMVSNLYAYNTYFIFICAYWGFIEGKIIRRKKYLYA